MDTPLVKWVLATSDRVYRLLLAVYPPAFRRAYGPHMAQVFRDCCRDTLRKRGLPGLLRLWTHTLADMIATAVKERMSEPRATKTGAPIRVVEGGQALFWSNNQPFDKFTRRARQTLQLATEEARAFDHPYIDTDHILLGLIREKGGLAAHVLGDLGVTLAQTRQVVTSAARATPPAGQGLTVDTHKVIGYAVEEAKRLQHHYIGTEHLLLGLVRVGEGTGAGALGALGVSPEQVRAEVTRILRRED